MARITLKPITNTLNAVETVNNNMAVIADIINNKATLRFLEGTNKSKISTDVDLNNQKVKGLLDGTTPQSLATTKQVKDTSSGSSGSLTISKETHIGGDTTTLLTSMTYDIGDGSLSVYKNGVRMVVGRDYEELFGNQVVWISSTVLSDNLDFYVTKVGV